MAVKKAGVGKYADGGGLYLVVTNKGQRSWVFRYSMDGKRREMGLGPTHTVGLAQAREKALEARQNVYDGRDPLLLRREDEAARRPALTFSVAAGKYIDAHRAEWKNEKHAAQWSSTLQRYVYPNIGGRDIASIETADVLTVLEPIWLEKNETASRVRMRIERVLDWATVAGHREGENPARWRGHLDQLLARPSKVQKVQHHKALPWRDVPAFLNELVQRDGVAARALEFTILTASRSGEVRGATWDEIDFEQRIWIVPRDRMKSGREHRVPLSDRAITILEDMRSMGESGLIFPTRKRGKPMSDMTMGAVLKRMGSDATVHGFRSSFRDWCAESTAYPPEVAEMALAHAVGSKVEAAYRRGDLFEKRRRLMGEWAAYCSGGPVERGQVVEMRR